jgi:hypothetical protein
MPASSSLALHQRRTGVTYRKWLALVVVSEVLGTIDVPSKVSVMRVLVPPLLRHQVTRCFCGMRIVVQRKVVLDHDRDHVTRTSRGHDLLDAIELIILSPLRRLLLQGCLTSKWWEVIYLLSSLTIEGECCWIHSPWSASACCWRRMWGSIIYY